MGMYLLPVTRYPLSRLGGRRKECDKSHNSSAQNCNANLDFDDRTIAHFAAQNIFPLEAPDAFFDDKDIDKYNRIIERK